MTTPQAKSSVAVYFEINEYTSAGLAADPETADLEPLIAAANEKLGGTVAKRNEGQRGINRAAAKRDYSYGAFIRSAESLERKARGAFPLGEKDPGYKRIFPQSPAALSRLPIEDREPAALKLQERLADEETPAELAKPVAEVNKRWKEYVAAQKAHAAALAGMSKARDKEQAAKAANVIALRKLEAELTKRFADDLKRVRSYFPPAARSQRKPKPDGAEQNGAAQGGKKETALAKL